MALASGALPVGALIEASRLNNSVECRAVDDQVADHWKCLRAPRLERERVSVLEKAHRQLAHRRAAMATVGHTIDQKSARAANSFAAVMFKGDRRIATVEEVFVEFVEHLEKRDVSRHIFHLVSDELAGCV